MSSPPPPNPTNSAAAATATADYFKSVARQRPRKHGHPAIYQTFFNPQPATTSAFPPPTQRQQSQQQSIHSSSRTHHQQSAAGGVLYPVASSGRGFISKHQQSNSDQNPAVGVVTNSDSFSHPASAYPYAVHRPYGFLNSDIPGQASHQLIAPSSAHLQHTLMSGGAIVPAFATGVSPSANPKVVAQSSVGEDNGLNNLRDKNGDGTFVIIRDRKVQVSEGTSLYAQCRSWLKNGFTLENQPHYVDCVKSLPKPLPASMVEARKEDDTEMEEKSNEDVEHLSVKELLQQHVKHAKKVRARLRNQRLQKIERYKDRLALLLPPVVDQQTKNDLAS